MIITIAANLPNGSTADTRTKYNLTCKVYLGACGKIDIVFPCRIYRYISSRWGKFARSAWRWINLYGRLKNRERTKVYVTERGLPMASNRITRRDFIKTTAAGAVATALGHIIFI